MPPAKKNASSASASASASKAKAATQKSAPKAASKAPSKAPSKAKASAAKVPEVPEVAVTVAATTDIVGAVVMDASDSTQDWSAEFTTVVGELSALRSTISQLTTRVRALQKRTEREMRAAQKASKKRKGASTDRKPSGFVKPALITAELAAFLGKPDGTEMARTEVTREINAYIREHDLQDPDNGRRIVPDQNLATLLKVSAEDELTYFNLQRYMSPHFIKAAAAQSTN